MSQDTGSSADQAFAAAWARVYGTGATDAAAPARLATAWYAQQSSGAIPQVHSPAATSWSPGHQTTTQAQASVEEQGLSIVQQPVDAQPTLAAAQSPLRTDTVAPQLHARLAETGVMHAADEGQMYGTDDGCQEEHSPEDALPLGAAAPQQPSKSFDPSNPNAVQQAQPSVHSPATGHKAGDPPASNWAGPSPTSVQAALQGRTPAVGTGTDLAGLAAAAAADSMQKTQVARELPDLEAKAMQIAMQVSLLLCKLWCLHDFCITC